MEPLARSTLDAMRWPAFADGETARLLALLREFERAERWPVEELVAHQFVQLEALLGHAFARSTGWRARLTAAGWRPGDAVGPASLATLPLLTRRDLQDAAASLACDPLPAACGRTTEVSTSGSTGEPVRVRKCELDNLYWKANVLRDHGWHERDVGGRLCSIRVSLNRELGQPPDGTVLPDWGPPVNQLWPSGPSALLDVMATVEQQAEWLLRHDPDYLLVMPVPLRALLDHFAANDLLPQSLREVRTVGETLPDEVRAACSEQWLVPVTDLYSSQELGYIALQCPAGSYHVMAESVLVEVLDDEGRPCPPGTVGRLVVTSLHNFAMPLVRYDIGDLAEVGSPCSCGRTLPTLSRVLGRSRNLVTLPGGRRRWPLVGYARYRAVAPVRQYQLVQHALDRVEMRLVVDRPLTVAEEAALAEVVRAALGAPFPVGFSYFDDRIPAGPGGKFEEFVSLVG